jgi:endonuclease-3
MKRNSGSDAANAISRPVPREGGARQLKNQENVLRLRARTIVSLLKREYPDARCALNFSTPEELLVATILSAQCTDNMVNRVTPGLFSSYPVPAGLAEASLSGVRKIIKPCGYYRQKSRYIRDACRMIVEKYGGSVPRTMDELLKLPGVARKTANVILSVAFGINEGIAVDTHVLRLSTRLGLASVRNATAAERQLMEILDRKQWGDFTTLLIAHGRMICTSRKPLCASCILSELCPSAFSFAGTKP